MIDLSNHNTGRPKLSVIISALNEKNIKACMESVKGLSPLEIIKVFFNSILV